MSTISKALYEEMRLCVTGIDPENPKASDRETVLSAVGLGLLELDSCTVPACPAHAVLSPHQHTRITAFGKSEMRAYETAMKLSRAKDLTGS